jgi:hypothetical protein
MASALDRSPPISAPPSQTGSPDEETGGMSDIGLPQTPRKPGSFATAEPEGKIHMVDPKSANWPISLTENLYKSLRVDPYSGPTL